MARKCLHLQIKPSGRSVQITGWISRIFVLRMMMAINDSQIDDVENVLVKGYEKDDDKKECDNYGR